MTGLGASIFGSMVGLGGGFIAVPILLLFFHLSPPVASGTSLVLIVANSGAGAVTYLLQKRVDVRTGLIIAAAGFPGSVLGALASARISQQLFDWALALFLAGVAADMWFNRDKRLHASKPDDQRAMSVQRCIAIGFAVGLVGSLFGIGGGVLVVPSLLYFSSLPAHMISATSHFAIVLTSPVGVITHWTQHDVLWLYAAPLAAGGLLGGPIGARLSLLLNPQRLVRFVSVAITIAAVALVVRDFVHA